MIWLHKLLQEEDGQDVVEYALFFSYTALVTVATVNPLRDGFTKICMDVGAAALAVEAKFGVIKQLADAIS